MKNFARGTVLLFLAAGARELPAQEELRIVATLPAYGSIALEIAGDRAKVTSIARGDEDAHFVSPRPSFAAALARADLFISTGLDLELWVPALLDRANNGKVVAGAPGSVAAYAGVELLQVPASVSRSEGDVHVFGNPHIYTDPINAIFIARNILAGLRRIDPANGELYAENTRRFEERIIRSLFGEELTDMLGADALFELARKDEFWEFAAGQTFRDKPLTDYVGGWMAMAAPFRNRRMACYHKNWAYFANRFDVRVRCLRRTESGHSALAGARQRGDRADAARTDSRPAGGQLLQPFTGGAGRGPHRCDGGHRAVQRGRCRGRGRLLRAHRLLGEPPGGSLRRSVAPLMVDLMLPALVAALILVGLHAYLGIHIIARGVIFVDLALAQLAAAGATVAVFFGLHADSLGGYVFALAATTLGAAVFSVSRISEPVHHAGSDHRHRLRRLPPRSPSFSLPKRPAAPSTCRSF